MNPSQRSALRVWLGSAATAAELAKPVDASDVNTPRGESARAEVARLRAFMLKGANVWEATTSITAAEPAGQEEKQPAPFRDEAFPPEPSSLGMTDPGWMAALGSAAARDVGEDVDGWIRVP